MSKRFIVFDLDGTLNRTDTYAVPAIADALADMGRTDVTREEIIDTFGAKDEDTNVRFFGDEADTKGPVFWEKVMTYIHGKYNDCYETFDGAAPLLKWLKKEGYMTAVCSNNANLAHIIERLQKLGIYEWIDIVKPVAVGKTKDEALCELLAEQTPDFALMVGDRYFDGHAARTNHIPFAACLYGYGKKEEFEGADIYLERLQDLVLYLWKLHKKPCRLIVLDIDGTLTDSKKQITKRTFEVLKKAQENGVKLVLASGRPTYGIHKVSEALELSKYGGYILAFNGGVITECGSGRKLFSKDLPDGMVKILQQCADEFGLPMVTYEGDCAITECPEDFYIQKEAAINGLNVQRIEKLGDYVNFPVTKCIITGDGERLAEVEPLMQKKFEGELSIYRSEPFFLEIMPRGIDKAQSLAKLLELLAMDREEMIAFGDGHNDATMIEFAGLGAAMDNAQPEVKEKADYISLSNDEDGVAYAVEKLIF